MPASAAAGWADRSCSVRRGARRAEDGARAPADISGTERSGSRDGIPSSGPDGGRTREAPPVPVNEILPTLRWTGVLAVSAALGGAAVLVAAGPAGLGAVLALLVLR